MIDYTTTLAALSITINVILAWVWNRKRKLAAFALKVKEAAADSKVTEAEFWDLFDAVDTLNTDDAGKK